MKPCMYTCNRFLCSGSADSSVSGFADSSVSVFVDSTVSGFLIQMFLVLLTQLLLKRNVPDFVFLLWLDIHKMIQFLKIRNHQALVSTCTCMFIKITSTYMYMYIHKNLHTLSIH